MTPCCRSAVHSTPLQTCNHVMFHCFTVQDAILDSSWSGFLCLSLPLNSSTGNSCQVPPALCAGLQFTAPRSHPDCTTQHVLSGHWNRVSPRPFTRFVRWSPFSALGLQPTLRRQGTAEQKHLMLAYGPDQTRSDQNHVLSANMLAQRRISS